MRAFVPVVLFFLFVPMVSGAGEYAVNYNVVVSDENDTAIMRVISLGTGSIPFAETSPADRNSDQNCTFLHMAFQNLTDQPIAVSKRIMRMEPFNYDGEYALREDGTYRKDMDIQRNVIVNWEQVTLSEKEIQYRDFPLCTPEQSEKYNLMVMELHFIWNEKKYYFSFNMPLKPEPSSE